jgi:tyrosinase
MAQKKTTKKAATKTAPKAAPGLKPLRRPSKIYVSSKIPLQPLAKNFHRADLVFDGVDHSGATFEARVFLNNSSATAKTATTAQNGYAGSFHIFGHGGCFGDVGHCDVRGLPRPYDPRPAHPLTPARKVVIATDAIRKAVTKGKQMTVTVVPIVRAGTPECDYDDVLKFDRISVRTYV